MGKGQHKPKTDFYERAAADMDQHLLTRPGPSRRSWRFRPACWPARSTDRRSPGRSPRGAMSRGPCGRRALDSASRRSRPATFCSSTTTSTCSRRRHAQPLQPLPPLGLPGAPRRPLRHPYSSALRLGALHDRRAVGGSLTWIPPCSTRTAPICPIGRDRPSATRRATSSRRRSVTRERSFLPTTANCAPAPPSRRRRFLPCSSSAPPAYSCWRGRRGRSRRSPPTLPARPTTTVSSRNPIGATFHYFARRVLATENECLE